MTIAGKTATKTKKAKKSNGKADALAALITDVQKREAKKLLQKAIREGFESEVDNDGFEMGKILGKKFRESLAKDKEFIAEMEKLAKASIIKRLKTGEVYFD